jgi:hypothetical protein
VQCNSRARSRPKVGPSRARAAAEEATSAATEAETEMTAAAGERGAADRADYSFICSAR